jgi:hypothetical protein
MCGLEISSQLISSQMRYYFFNYLNDTVGWSMGKSIHSIKPSMGKTGYTLSIGICWSVGISSRCDGRSVGIGGVRQYKLIPTGLTPTASVHRHRLSVATMAYNDGLSIVVPGLWCSD